MQWTATLPGVIPCTSNKSHILANSAVTNLMEPLTDVVIYVHGAELVNTDTRLQHALLLCCVTVAPLLLVIRLPIHVGLDNIDNHETG